MSVRPAKKYLVWQAICGCGKISEPYITTGNMNGQIYRDECLQKRPLPLFWPDLATCHYAKPVMKWYEANDVVFVPKEANPPNSPELRPTEKCWAVVKDKLRRTGKVFKNDKDLKKEWMKGGTSVAQYYPRRGYCINQLCKNIANMCLFIP